ncbi:hypothetical protein BT96DRAFT_619791 [Gymnopus androsaceus JB14]|uniref:F-box domain-containing protein n=1 Tax=Gymnopus androsaceus JB14 TaxID=1447944 RepID=A0A6A4HSK0_9AGAR|nr:hypothetical protein BT96DRAFT_619791 [Gymnopus androsaceus JB14]
MALQATHPIHSLPVEVLTQIFGSYCSLDSCFAVTLDRGGKISTPSQPLARTCSVWRQIVCSRSEFWSSFDLNFEFMITPELCDLLITYIRHSGATVTLRLSITFPDSESLEASSSNVPTDMRLVVLDILFDHSNRWRDVRIDIGPKILAHAISRLTLRPKPLHGYFPKLERLDSQDQESAYFDYAEEQSERNLFHIFRPCPQLRSLSAHDSWRDDPVDYSNLTYLNLMYYRGLSLSPPLSRCPHLRHFSIGWCSIPVDGDFDYDGVNIWSNDNPFHHRGITRLSLPMYDVHFGHEIWEDLRFPSLSSLDVDQVDNLGEGTTELLSMISKSECTLRVLGIGKMSTSILARFLSVAPSLHSLNLMSQYSYHALREEAEQMFSPLMCKELKLSVPELSSLVVEFHGSHLHSKSTTDVAQQFRDMVVSRLTPSQFVELQIL